MFRLAAILSLFALPAFAEPPKVVADIAPVHALVAQVMEGVATPELLLSQDANPHSVQLRPSQARMLADADLVIWVGPELSPWLERALDNLGSADQIALTASPTSHLRDFTEADAHDHEDEHAEDEDHDEHEGEDHDGEDEHDHVHEGTDPHLWLSPNNARAWLGLFAEDLAARDPENAAAYRANAEAAEARIDALNARIEARLAPHQGAAIVTFHAAFGYFAERFGIEIAGSVRPGDAATPSAAAVAKLKELVAEHGVTCAFAEPGYDPGLIEALAAETGLRIGTLDPTGALQEPGPGQYDATLDAIANALADCLDAG